MQARNIKTRRQVLKEHVRDPNRLREASYAALAALQRNEIYALYLVSAFYSAQATAWRAMYFDLLSGISEGVTNGTN